MKLRNLSLRNLAKFVFAKLKKHDLLNNAKQREMLIAKIAKVAKVELHCKTIIQITKHCKYALETTVLLYFFIGWLAYLDNEAFGEDKG